MELYDKKDLKDSMGRGKTQSLFYEHKYEPEAAVFTVADQDKTEKGKTFYSLKKLFLEMGDLTCYAFANEYLINWNHWKRLENNTWVNKFIEEWKEELDLKLRAESLFSMREQANEEGSFQAQKFMIDRQYDKRGAGRPSKKDKQLADKRNKDLDDEFSADVLRLREV